jgi:hypothetical protein
MTDDEKAATFIGWTPEQCQPEAPYDVWFRADSGSGSMRELVQGPCPHGHFRPHPIPAPDMSKPQNYMRALEVVAQREDLTCDVAFGVGVAGWWVALGDDCGVGAFKIGVDGRLAGMGRTLSDAAVAVLAALYEADHPM